MEIVKEKQVEYSLEDLIINAREKCNTLKSNQYLDFDGKSLTLCEHQQPVKSWGAISGKPEYQYKDMQHILNKGPLPEGMYNVPLKELQKWENLSLSDRILSTFGRGPWPWGIPTWGTKRVSLVPDSQNKMYGRRNFFIHGGFFPGSGGCIDLTNQMSDFAKWFEDNAKDTPLVVKYK